MPIYEYLCNNCQHEFELLQKVTEKVATECPECEKSDIKRLVSATSFRLKGSGWYETDFKDKPNNKDKNALQNKSDVKSTSKTETDTGDKSTKSQGSENKGSSKPTKSKD